MVLIPVKGGTGRFASLKNQFNPHERYNRYNGVKLEFDFSEVRRSFDILAGAMNLGLLTREAFTDALAKALEEAKKRCPWEPTSLHNKRHPELLDKHLYDALTAYLTKTPVGYSGMITVDSNKYKYAPKIHEIPMRHPYVNPSGQYGEDKFIEKALHAVMPVLLENVRRNLIGNMRKCVTVGRKARVWGR